jgi:hypothetical protein
MNKDNIFNYSDFSTIKYKSDAHNIQQLIIDALKYNIEIVCNSEYLLVLDNLLKTNIDQLLKDNKLITNILLEDYIINSYKRPTIHINNILNFLKKYEFYKNQYMYLYDILLYSSHDIDTYLKTIKLDIDKYINYKLNLLIYKITDTIFIDSNKLNNIFDDEDIDIQIDDDKIKEINDKIFNDFKKTINEEKEKIIINKWCIFKEIVNNNKIFLTFTILDKEQEDKLSNKYFSKYLKYKEKYLELKDNKNKNTI